VKGARGPLFFNCFAMISIVMVSFGALAQTTAKSSDAAPIEPPYPSSVTPPVDIGEHICSVMNYPAAAIKAHAEGKVILSFVVTTAGDVHDIEVVTSSGSTALDNASIECVLPWRFQPAEQDGKPIAVIKKAAQVWRLRF
jgi:protein TonB